ncbi:MULTISPECIES: nicotinamide riboside transporter PnuC [Pseudomonadaceae]|jgi:nicotinamide mononucleotide transporter|uniref:nicotinamide riboside transporter PnuC n=1 Tax=Pseudomonadaceae TaxID=135621 RepID=UPI000D1AAAE3|nr:MULTISPECIES: nicotinamide riboside transporter PnuC [Pseudomonas]MDH0334984.1 nicotinamide riboside transporter PnuC [Pseudomonas otitidis]MDH1106557.1 nicotinamide riboside transporter PnuC [Pseudomonas otitidis]MDH1157629.1 nicotinamide riboside transporter PnuC [Pseudomonas otitidis]MDH1162741.1 nicotinamide riboside transporter PnuC [Pseudomonas otitidis]MEE1893448.1 nicotinamide riboside transporter PnuC [Pseudomonas otitidis]
MPSTLELVADLVNLIAVLLAARNSVHTWSSGILGCVLFGWLFFESQLYADVTLQGFFIVTSALGWWAWLRGNAGTQLPVSRTAPGTLAWMAALAVVVALAYGALLHHFTDAYAPLVDSLVLTFSVLAQLLLMRRRLENWYAWLLVNTLAVPLYASRELYLTAGLYTLFWCNAWYGLYRWRRELREAAAPVAGQEPA